jgi:hypothetical protein
VSALLESQNEKDAILNQILARTLQLSFPKLAVHRHTAAIGYRDAPDTLLRVLERLID